MAHSLRRRRLKITLARHESCATRFDVPEPTNNRQHYIRMPRYHFHIVDGVQVFDSLGATLPTDEAARVHAERLAQRSMQSQFERLHAKAIRVTSETGAVLFRIPIPRDARRES